MSMPPTNGSGNVPLTLVWHVTLIFLAGYMGVSENSVPLNPMVLLIIIPIKWLLLGIYPTFSDKPICSSLTIAMFPEILAVSHYMIC